MACWIIRVADRLSSSRAALEIRWRSSTFSGRSTTFESVVDAPASWPNSSRGISTSCVRAEPANSSSTLSAMVQLPLWKLRRFFGVDHTDGESLEFDVLNHEVVLGHL